MRGAEYPRTIALNDLRRNRRRLQAQSRADFFFDFRIEQRKRSHCAADFSDGDGLSSAPKPVSVATHLVVPKSEGQAKGGWFSVNAMRAADLRSVLKLKGATLENFEQRLDFLKQDVAGASQ